MRDTPEYMPKQREEQSRASGIYSGFFALAKAEYEGKYCSVSRTEFIDEMKK